MNRSEAEALLATELARAGHPRRSTVGWAAAHNPEAISHDWWRANMKVSEQSDTPRSIGYLTGYVRIARYGLLTATGLPLDDGYIWMDRSVIKRFEGDGYLLWAGPLTEPHFEITPRGALLIARISE